MAAARWLFILSYVFSSVESLYEDQVGKVDWKRSYVGRTLLAQYDESSQNSRRFLSVSDSGVLASVNTRTGKIEWRQVFTDGLDAMVHVSSRLVTYHRDSGLLRSWNTESGYLVWESAVELSAASCPGRDLRVSHYCKNGALLHLIDSNTLVVMDSVSHVVLLVQMSSGKIKWKQSIPPGHTYAGLAVDESVYAVGVHTREVFVQELLREQGSLGNNRSIPTQFLVNEEQCTLSGPVFICINSESSVVQYFNVKTDKTFTRTTLESLGINANPQDLSIMSLWQPTSKENLVVIAATTYPLYSWILKIENSKLLKLDRLDSNRLLIQVQDEIAAVGLVDGHLNLNIYDVEEKEISEKLSSSLRWLDTVGPPKHCLAHIYQRNDGSHGYRLIVFTEDDAILQIKHPGELGWVREEAPAGITSHMIWDLLQLDAPPQSSDEITGLSQFINRLQYQAKEVQEFIQALNYNSFVNMFTSKRAKVFSRDEFNVRKLLLLATRSGKLFGVSTEDGQYIWNRWIPNIGVYSERTHLLFKLRGLTHPPLEPLSVLLAPGKEDCDGTVIVQFNPLTGKDTVPPSCEPFHIIQVAPLPVTDSQYRNLLLMALRDGTFRLYPQSEETATALDSFGQEIYMYRVSKEEGVVEGFQLKLDKKSNEVECERVWSINFTSTSQKIVSVAMRSSDEVVNAQAKVSGEHAILFKYLNPHLIAIATESESSERSSVDIYTIDVVSGHFVSHIYHRQHRSPVHMVLSENWLLYYLYNSKAWRYELVVMEMYENTTKRPTEAWSSFMTHPSPVVLKQSYILPKPIVALTTTQTLRGITERNIIFGLASGHLYSLPKLLFDPRRTLQQLPGIFLPPYFPEILMNASEYLNYNQTISLLHKLTTHPTGLESTSLVVAYGIDLYVTLVSPSKTFDQLADDFDHQLVALVLGGLVLGGFVLSRLAHNKTVRKLWK